MPPIDIAAIEWQARQLRAQEMQRIRILVSARLHLHAKLLAATTLSALAAIGSGLRHLISSNPHARHPS